MATSLLDEALAISTELGMKPLTERVLLRREVRGRMPNSVDMARESFGALKPSRGRPQPQTIA